MYPDKNIQRGRHIPHPHHSRSLLQKHLQSPPSALAPDASYRVTTAPSHPPPRAPHASPRRHSSKCCPPLAQKPSTRNPPTPPAQPSVSFLSTSFATSAIHSSTLRPLKSTDSPAIAST